MTDEDLKLCDKADRLRKLAERVLSQDWAQQALRDMVDPLTASARRLAAENERLKRQIEDDADPDRISSPAWIIANLRFRAELAESRTSSPVVPADVAEATRRRIFGDYGIEDDDSTERDYDSLKMARFIWSFIPKDAP